MQLPELCIKRPVFATVLSLMIVLIGVISFQRLTVREYPKIDTPVVSVRTVYKGASPQVMESQITQPLEDSISGIEGVRSVKSVSREEVSQITVEFALERNVDSASNDVRDRVARVRALLPAAADDSVVSKIEADAQAILWMRLSSQQHSALELSDYADRYVADRMKTLPGVASVIIGGERRYAMRLWLDRDRLAAYGLTPQDVENGLRRQNVEIPSGRIESSQREFTVLTEADLRTPAQFDDMILTEARGYPVRLRDVGRAQLGALDERSVLRVNGNPAVGLGIVKQSTANTLSVANAAKAELARLQGILPEGMTLQVAFDSSVFIARSIDGVYRTMIEAVLLVMLVIFVFLRSVRATLIPFVTIPVSLIGAFFFLFLMGFSVNVLTLLGLVLAIGLVVDDAIVVLENCHRHVEMGKEPRQASIDGSKEIAFAVVAMSLTLAAVFAPLGFMTGNTGRLFTEFALTVAAAVAVSGVVALTLTPMMCSKILQAHESHGRIYQAMERFFTGMNAAYRRSLGVVLKAWWAVVVVFALVVASAVLLYQSLKSELSPLEDRGFFLSLIIAPEGASLDYTDGYMRQVEGTGQHEVRPVARGVGLVREGHAPDLRALFLVEVGEEVHETSQQIGLGDEHIDRKGDAQALVQFFDALAQLTRMRDPALRAGIQQVAHAERQQHPVDRPSRPVARQQPEEAEPRGAVGLAVALVRGVAPGGVDQHRVGGEPPVAVARAADAADHRLADLGRERELESGIDQRRRLAGAGRPDDDVPGQLIDERAARPGGQPGALAAADA